MSESFAELFEESLKSSVMQPGEVIIGEVVGNIISPGVYIELGAIFDGQRDMSQDEKKIIKLVKNENEGEFSFYIRKVPGGEFTEWLFAENRVGTDISLSAPFGQFYHRPLSSHMVCMAGGSGMSAIKAILEECVLDQVERNCIFLFGAQTEKDLYCMDDMMRIKEQWNKNYTFEFVEVLSADEEGSSWTGPTGFVTDYFKEAYLDTS